MKYKDYYKTLGLERGAGDDDIKKAYRKLARRYHPDVSKEANAKEKFQEVAEAYETLKDKEKRAAYDRLGQHRPGEDFRPRAFWEIDRGRAHRAGIYVLDGVAAAPRGHRTAPSGRKRAARSMTLATTRAPDASRRSTSSMSAPGERSPPGRLDVVAREAGK